MNQLKLFFTNKIPPTIWISLFLVLAAIILYFSLNDSCEYKANAITELFGILVTILFVNVIFSRNTKKTKGRRELKKILVLNNLFYIYLNLYKNTFVNIFGEGDLKYSDLSKLLQPSNTRLNFGYNPSYSYFFKIWINLYEQSQKFLINLDLEMKDGKPLVEILEGFIINNMLVYSIYEGLKNRQKLTMGEDKKNIFEFDKEWIEKIKEPKKISEHVNISDIYTVIFELLKNNEDFIKKYDEIINKITKLFNSKK